MRRIDDKFVDSAIGRAAGLLLADFSGGSVAVLWVVLASFWLFAWMKVFWRGFLG